MLTCILIINAIYVAANHVKRMIIMIRYLFVGFIQATKLETPFHFEKTNNWFPEAVDGGQTKFDDEVTTGRTTHSLTEL